MLKQKKVEQKLNKNKIKILSKLSKKLNKKIAFYFQKVQQKKNCSLLLILSTPDELSDAKLNRHFVTIS